MARDMSPEEYHAFLMHGTRTGKLATVRRDGRPHVAPIWFVMDGDTLVLNTAEGSVKAQNIAHEPRVSLTVDDQQPPYSFVIVEGLAEIVDASMDELLYWATAIGGRYMGAERAEAFGRRNAVPGELLVRIHPNKVIAKMNLSD